ncbi:hypothetical protein [Agaribacterium haliotis]|uniref:hypothetical protein n=1 Tax=Agaribacterium haliotis TaxID=2013869 RepID=UPI000BB53105|nr:hypothetical protein [Agaribacterium haliotis]
MFKASLIAIYFSTFCLVAEAASTQHSNNKSDNYLGISLYTDGQTPFEQRTTAELSVMTGIKKPLSGKLALIYHSGENKQQQREGFTGLSASLYFSPGNDYLRTYIGGGVFTGTSNNCDNDNNSDINDSSDNLFLNMLIDNNNASSDNTNYSYHNGNQGDCRETWLGGLYPEVGLALNLGQLRIYPFARKVIDSYSGFDGGVGFGIQLSMRNHGQL